MVYPRPKQSWSGRTRTRWADDFLVICFVLTSGGHPLGLSDDICNSTALVLTASATHTLSDLVRGAMLPNRTTEPRSKWERRGMKLSIAFCHNHLVRGSIRSKNERSGPEHPRLKTFQDIPRKA
ncbi:hypothetical protein M433DRAFT_10247 [Acidomyces richmondensis BFW]|nr:hypothetical protein M433DRAFT_10247 [Acidomyces richmondensis BFW]